MNWNVTRTIQGHAAGKRGSREPIRWHRSLSASCHTDPRRGIRHILVPERHCWASSQKGSCTPAENPARNKRSHQRWIHFLRTGKPIRWPKLHRMASIAKKPKRPPIWVYARHNRLWQNEGKGRLWNSWAPGPSGRSDNGVLLAQGVGNVNTQGNGT